MQKYRNLIAVFIFSCWSFSFAHPGGHGPEKLIHCEEAQNCTRAEADKVGAVMIEFLTKANQLELSWNNSQRVGHAREVSVNETKGWVIEYQNPEIADKDKQTLYIVIAKDGYLLGTTYDKTKLAKAASDFKS